MYVMVSESDFSATQAIASEVCPTKYSPIISSVVVVEELLIDVRSIDGADGVPSTVVVSKTPCILIISGTFNEMVLSSTLVP